MSEYKQRGFTLVEIVIVLVIVGLLIGAVLKSQEMITNANIKRIENDKADLTAAVLAYQDRYKMLPGDDNEADSRFATYTGVLTANGNGDGQIGAGDNWDTVVAFPWAADDSHEPSKAFAHLRAAGLIGGAPDNSDRPNHAYGGPIGIQNGALGISEHTIVFGAVEGAAVRILESRIDDGAPESGRLQADLASQTMTAGDTSTIAGYFDTERYNFALPL